jgi:hypothetical protein
LALNRKVCTGLYAIWQDYQGTIFHLSNRVARNWVQQSSDAVSLKSRPCVCRNSEAIIILSLRWLQPPSASLVGLNCAR